MIFLKKFAVPFISGGMILKAAIVAVGAISYLLMEVMH